MMNEILKDLKNQIKDAGSLRKFAYKHGFEPSFISQVLNNKSKPSPRLLTAMGWKKDVIYSKEKGDD